MILPFSESAISIANTLAIAIPCMLGVMKAIEKRTGFLILLLLFSARVGWISVNFVNLASNWNLEHQVSVLQASQTPIPDKLLDVYANDGASNTFALILGWLPATLTFLCCFGITRFLWKLTHKKST